MIIQELKQMNRKKKLQWQYWQNNHYDIPSTKNWLIEIMKKWQYEHILKLKTNHYKNTKMVKRKTMTFYCYYIFFGPKNKKGKKKKKHNKSLFTLLCTSQIVHFFLPPGQCTLVPWKDGNL